MKLCKNCNHMRIPNNMENSPYFWKCHKLPIEVSPVSGETAYEFCTNARSTFGACTEAGDLWQEKQGE